jgi:hypothetical protein
MLTTNGPWNGEWSFNMKVWVLIETQFYEQGGSKARVFAVYSKHAYAEQEQRFNSERAGQWFEYEIEEHEII